MFAQTCETSAAPTPGHACFTIRSPPDSWAAPNDGPAIHSGLYGNGAPHANAAVIAGLKSALNGHWFGSFY